MNLIYSKTRVYEEGTNRMLPWLNKHALDELTTFVMNDWLVFEYGSGHSTLWWSDETKHIFSVEHNKSFYNIMKTKMKSNCDYFFRNRIKRKQSPYVNAINEHDHNFDCIIVDGRDRNLCILNSYEKLNKGGLFILDNSERIKYKAGVDLLNSKFKLYFKSPIDKTKGQSPYIWETTIWMNV